MSKKQHDVNEVGATGTYENGTEGEDFVQGETKSQRFNRIARNKLVGILTQVKRLRKDDNPDFDRICTQISEVKDFFTSPDTGNKKIEKLTKSIDALRNLTNPQVYEYDLDTIAENLDLLISQVRKVQAEFEAAPAEEEKIFHF